MWTPTRARAVRGASGREFRTNHRAVLTAGEAESKGTGAPVVYELWVDPSNLVIIDPKSSSSSSTSSSNTLGKEWVVLELSAPSPIAKPVAKSAATLVVPAQVPRGSQQQARAGTTPKELGKVFAAMTKASAANVSASSAATAAKPPAAAAAKPPAAAVAKPPAAAKQGKAQGRKPQTATPSAAHSEHSAGGLAAVPERGTEAATPAEPPPESNNYQLLHGPVHINSPVKPPLAKLPPGFPKVVKDVGPRVADPCKNKDKERAEQADEGNGAGSEGTVSDAESDDSGELTKTPDPEPVKPKTPPAAAPKRLSRRQRGKK